MTSKKGRIMALVVFVLIALLSTGTFAADITLTMVIDSRPTYQEWQKRIIAEFERENPGVKVDTIVQSGSVSAQQTTLLAAGVALDLGFADPHTITSWGRSGILTDLAPYVERAKGQYVDWYPSALNLYKVKDGMYGLPIDLQIGGIFYNADAFSEAGLREPTENWTYGDLKDLAVKLLITDAEGQVRRYGYKIPTWRNWVSTIWAFGGDFVDDWTYPTKFTGKSQGTIDALSYLNDLVVSQAVQDYQTHRALNVTRAFSEGSIAMALSNTISMYQFGNIKEFTWDVAPLPKGPQGRVTFINAIGWFIPTVSQHKEEAWALLRKFTSAESLKWLVEMVQTVPPSRSAIVSSWLPSVQTPKNKAMFLVGVEEARAPGTLPASIYDPIYQLSHSAIWGEAPPGTAVENMEQLVNLLILDLDK